MKEQGKAVLSPKCLPVCPPKSGDEEGAYLAGYVSNRAFGSFRYHFVDVNKMVLKAYGRIVGFSDNLLYLLFYRIIIQHTYKMPGVCRY